MKRSDQDIQEEQEQQHEQEEKKLRLDSDTKKYNHPILSKSFVDDDIVLCVDNKQQSQEEKEDEDSLYDDLISSSSSNENKKTEDDQQTIKDSELRTVYIKKSYVNVIKRKDPPCYEAIVHNLRDILSHINYDTTQCIVCRNVKHSKACGDWKSCDTCLRKICYECIKDNEKDDYNSYDSDDEFICEQCDH